MNVPHRREKEGKGRHGRKEGIDRQQTKASASHVPEHVGGDSRSNGKDNGNPVEVETRARKE